MKSRWAPKCWYLSLCLEGRTVFSTQGLSYSWLIRGPGAMVLFSLEKHLFLLNRTCYIPCRLEEPELDTKSEDAPKLDHQKSTG